MFYKLAAYKHHTQLTNNTSFNINRADADRNINGCWLTQN